jgi:hypothetical protein
VIMKSSGIASVPTGPYRSSRNLVDDRRVVR